MKSMDRRTFLEMSFSALCVGALTACGNNGSQQASENEAADAKEPTIPAGTIEGGVLISPYAEGYDSGLHHATIEVEGMGTIKVEVNATNAPITVSNFAHLVNEGFYDGLTFHRVVKGFMIQGGSPNGDGKGGSGTKVKGEFSENGVVNAIQHKRGVISMARSSANDSGSTQFFIMHEDNTSIDGKYAAFGKVTEGMDVVDMIAEIPVEDDYGTVAPENQPVIKSIKMDD